MLQSVPKSAQYAYLCNVKSAKDNHLTHFNPLIFYTMKKGATSRKPAANVAQTTPATAETAAVLRVVKDDEPTEQEQRQDEPSSEAAPAEQPTAQAAEQEQPAAPVAAASVAAAPAPSPATLEELTERVNKIKAIADRLTNHRHTGEQLAAFQLGTSGFQDTLTLRDGTGREWKTNRTPAIQLVLDMLRGELRTITAATEAELRELLSA